MRKYNFYEWIHLGFIFGIVFFFAMFIIVNLIRDCFVC